MTAIERTDLLIAKLVEDFKNISNNPLMYRNDFAGVYIKDDIFHIILVNNADIEHYQKLFNDNSVEYHYTDVSFTDLIQTRNWLRDYYDRFGIVSAAIIDELSVIELTITDENSITTIKQFLLDHNFTKSFINAHFSFVVGTPLHIYFDEEQLPNDCRTVNATTYTANPGKKLQGYNTYSSSTLSLASVGFSAKTTVNGIVTAWHYAVHTSKHYWGSYTSNGYFATNASNINSSMYDAAFIPFNSGDGSTTNVSKTINNTNKTLTHVATTNTISALSGKTLHFYGHKNPNSIGTVNSTSVDYVMSYTNSSGTTSTITIKDTIRTTGASLDHGDSGGPVTYEGTSNITLVGIVSGKSSTYQYISKITNIRSALGVSVTG